MANARGLSTPSKLTLLGALYFSQGLPYGFFTQALPVLLRKQGLSLAEIGLSSLLVLPWALKFLWAPLVDKHSLPWLGRRASWILPLQLLSALVLGALALLLELRDIHLLMGAFLLLNLLAATQDIATDGLAVDLLLHHERGFANGLQVAGYRVGMIIGGGVLLILFDSLGSVGVFASMSVLTLFATTPLLLVREPETTSPREQIKPRGPHFLCLPDAPKILALLVVFKAGDAFATAMLRPFLADAGLTLEDIGWLLGTVGFVSGLMGALLGGALVNRLGRQRALLVFGTLQALSIASYALIAYGPLDTTSLYLACALEHFAGGTATAALFTCMMDWSRPSNATDYTVQASAVVIATGLASALAGFSAQSLGYFGHFCAAAGAGLASLAVVWLCFPKPSPERTA
jgi:MFS transporter, PAT family, beta-lactamase induction signal transducer AmpG